MVQISKDIHEIAQAVLRSSQIEFLIVEQREPTDVHDLGLIVRTLRSTDTHLTELTPVVQRPQTETPADPQETAINLPTEGEVSKQSDVNL